MTPLRFVIRYQMAYEDQALALARRLFARFDEAIDTLALTPVEEDDFSLFLDGVLVRSQRDSGSAPRVADVIATMSDE